MKRIVLIIVVLFGVINFLFCTGYVKFNTDKKLSNNNSQIQFYENEIYRISSLSKKGVDSIIWYSIIVNNESFECSNSVDSVENVDLSYYSQKGNFIYSKNSSYFLDIKKLKKIISKIKLYTDDKKIKFDHKTGKIGDFAGNTVRLIIPNAPTIWYNIDDIREEIIFFDLKTIILIGINLLLVIFLLIKIIHKPHEASKKMQEYKEKFENYKRLLKDFEETKHDKGMVEKEKKLLLEKYNAIQRQLSEKETIHQRQITNIGKETEEKIKKKDQQFADKLKEIEEQNKANAVILEKVRKADILKEYAGKVVSYIDFGENIMKIANKKTDNADIEIAKIMSVLLQQTLLKTVDIEKWKQICNDIIDTDIVIQNKDLKNCFQSNNEIEQLNAFKKQSISKLKIFTNSILILCESYRNLSKFIENVDVVNIESEFRNMIAEINNNAKEIGITEISEVRIFTSIDSNNAGSVDGRPSLPYSIVKNLKQDDIVEIISYGMKTEFEDMTKTKVLIK
ncbi:MAG: hypothetical protein LBU83_08485 [Bacteroidales bacterium]|jgi:hypothetical protein|nr:hypothetical protein [Bacteroidales bacterium]